MTSFKVSKAELGLIQCVVLRTMNLMPSEYEDLQDLEMDLIATNANGCPLDFEKFLAFDDFNFKHDIVGIKYNLNRHTGKLNNFFVPRCAKPEPRGEQI